MCLICKSTVQENPAKWCNTNNVGYKLFCETCQNKGVIREYEGETARSARLRGGEHYRDFLKENQGSVLYKHQQLEHEGEQIEVGMKITKTFKDPLTRQANEAVRINNGISGQLLNSKNEFNHPPIARVVIKRKKTN